MVSLCSWVACLLLLMPGPLDKADDQARYIDGLSDRGLHELIVDEAQSFLADYSSHERANLVRYRLGTALFELDRKNDARSYFATLARVGSFRFRAEACLRLGQCELDGGRNEQAAVALATVLTLDAAYLHIPATYLLAEIDFSQQRWADAFPRYAEVLQGDPNGPYSHDASSALAWSRYRLSDHEATASLIKSMLAGQLPDDNGGELRRELQFLHGESLLALDRPTAALAAYESVGTGPYADGALRGAGFAHVQLNDQRSAAHSFEQLVERFPSSPFASEAMFQLGVQRLALNDGEGALDALSSAVVVETAEIYYWRARALTQLGRSDEALTALDRADASSPSDELAGHVQVARGDLLVASGRSAEAAKAYAQAYSKGSSSGALHAAAVSSLNSGDPSTALQLVDQLLAEGANDQDIHLTRGEALFALEQWDLALGEFSKLPHSTRAASRQAWCHYQLGELATAAQHFGALATDHSGAAEAEEALAMEGRSHSEQGHQDQAHAAWQRYLQRFPEGGYGAEALLGLARGSSGEMRIARLTTLLDGHSGSEQAPHALLELGDALAEAGNLAQAAAAYQRLLAEFPD
ncbi:MAG: tetratricopeptide (TPR) repeat protein, partial [Pseudohongiellaceae bacterium]